MENNLKSKAINSTFWKFSERFLAQFVSVMVSIILARLLCPEDYGIVSIVTIFFVFANVFITAGLNTALIQKKNTDQRDYSTICIFSLIISILLYVILFFIAPFISTWYSNANITKLIRVMSLILPINTIKSVLCAYISNTLQFQKFFWSTLIGTIISAVIGICMAYRGYGYWALVVQQMSNSFIDTVILFFLTKIHIFKNPSIKRFFSLSKYGWKIFISALIDTIYNQLIPIIIGKKYTSADLSYYTKGKSFPDTITTAINSTISAVLFPVLSKVQDDKEALLRYTRLFIRTASYVIFPLMIGFFMISKSFIIVVLTEKWLPTLPYLKIFCLTSMFCMIHTGNCESIKAIGRSDVFLIMEIIKKVLYFIIIISFLFLSKSPLILTYSQIICTIIAILVNTIPSKKIIGYNYLYQMSDLCPNLIISIIMGICVYFLGFLEINCLLLMIIQIFFGILVYLFLSIITKNKSYNYLFKFIVDIYKSKKNGVQNERIKY